MPRSKAEYKFKSEVWLYPGMAGWHFISLPKKDAEKIRQDYSKQKRGWGSLPVSVTIGKTTWETSIFPEKKSSTYLLPLKAQVRRAEDINRGDIITIRIKILL